MMSTIRLALLGFATISAAADSVKLSVPDAPPAGTPTLDGSYQGYSMEMASYPNIAGNKSSPNKLSIRLLQNLKDITGSAAHIRVGGTTANFATWIPEQQKAIIQNFATPGADQPANISLGPAYLESFKTFPKGTQYTVGLTFNSGSQGEDGTVNEAAPFYQGLGDDLFAFEVGNEFDAFPVDRAANYTIQKYVPEWLDRTAAIARRVFSKNTPTRMFQAGVFLTPGAVSADLTWTAQTAFSLGIASTGRVKTYSTHQYFGAACSPVKPTLAGTLMNRTAFVRAMKYNQIAAPFTVSKGVPYVIGETNSIACQGLAGVSDVFGASLWSIDYALYAAAINVSGIYWHMGTGYRYAAWQATQNGTTAPGPRPLYYGNLFTATALGGANKQVVTISNTTSLAGYAIYSAARPRQRAQLEKIVLVNMDVFNSTAITADKRPSVDFQIPTDPVDKCSKVSVRRLTAAGAEVKDGITWAGRTVALNGSIVGAQVTEDVTGGTVNVKASEAVLISFKH